MVFARLLLTSMAMAYSEDTSDGASYDLSSYDRWLQAAPSVGPSDGPPGAECAANVCTASSRSPETGTVNCAANPCTVEDCCQAAAVSSATCAADVCTASSRSPVEAAPTCALDTCSVEECCQAAATATQVTKVTSTITAGLDFDPAASGSAEKVLAFKTGVMDTLGLPDAVTADMVALSFVAVSARRLESHVSTTSYTVTVEITLPAGVTAATVEAAVSGVDQAVLSSNIMSAFAAAGLPVPTLTVSAMSAPVTATETVTVPPTAASGDEDNGAASGSLFSAVAIALVASAIA